MSTDKKKDTGDVVSFPQGEKKKTSSTEKIWGKAVYGHGYAGIPSILIQGQRRLGLTAIQMNVIIQLLDYWHEPTRRPFPTKKELAKRMDVSEKTIQNTTRALEDAGFLRREQRKSAAGDWSSNIYHLDGLVAKVRALEPLFAEARADKKAAKAKAEMPKHLRN